MIISTLFMQKHGLVLDFDKDLLYVRGKAMETLTAGQDSGRPPARQEASSLRPTGHERQKGTASGALTLATVSRPLKTN